jgi:hypothetical protein
MRWGESFDGCCRTYWHKPRCFDDAMRRMKNTCTGMSVTAFTDAVESEIGVIQSFLQNRSQMKVAGSIDRSDMEILG